MNRQSLRVHIAAVLLPSLLLIGCRQQAAPPAAGPPEVAVLTSQTQPGTTSN